MSSASGGGPPELLDGDVQMSSDRSYGLLALVM